LRLLCQPCQRRTSWAIASPPRGQCDATDSPWFGAAALSTAGRHGRCAAALACASAAGPSARKGSLPALQPAHRVGIRALLQGLHPLSQAAPLLRDVLAARRTRHPHSSGPARTRARGNDHDLHTRIEDGRRPSSRVCQPLATGATVEIPGPSCGGRALFKWPCWLPLSCRLPMSASGRERSSIPHDQHGAPSIHPSTPQTKRSGGDSDSRKDIQSGAASNAVVRAAGELPVAARPAWRCKSEGFSDPSPASYPVVQAAYNMERSTFHAIGRLQHAARRYLWVS
jgi:hypothetical protein